MRPIVAALILLSILFVGSISPVVAQGPTETPTPTPTETSTPTETPTITPTPDLYQLATLEAGQSGGIIYIVTAGQAAIFSELSFISIILLLFVFVALRRRV